MATTKNENKMLPDMVAWFRETYPEIEPMLVFVPRANITLSKKGAVYGSADLILLYPTNGYSSLCIQVLDKRQTEPQMRWRVLAEHAGNKCVMVRDLVGFAKVVEDYLSNSPYA
jgi:hypothetical protein